MVVAKFARTTLTRAWAVLNCLMAAADNGDMNVKFAKAAVTNRNVSSPPFKRERPGVKMFDLIKQLTRSFNKT